MWKCLCDCQLNLPEIDRKYTYTTASNLYRGISNKKGGTSSCGCYKSEVNQIIGKNNKRHNKYDLSGEYGIGYTSQGDVFYFDLEDYKYIKDYCWNTHTGGYIRAYYHTSELDNSKQKRSYIMIHQLLSGIYGYGKEPDHINGKPWDNRKQNLRKSTHEQNMKNCKIYKNNTSGHKGVYYSKRGNRWKAFININKKRVHLGTFLSYEDAVKRRETAEEKYYGEFNRRKENLIIHNDLGRR